VIDGSPVIAGLAVDLHEVLIQVLPPLGIAADARYSRHASPR
jgi:hypothetical protein